MYQDTLSRKARRWLGEDWRLGFLLMAPVVVLVLGLIAYPFVSAVILSLTDKSIGRPAHFVGLRNYIQLAKDPYVQRAIINTIEYTTVNVGFKLLLGLGMALALNKVVKGRDILAGMLIIPWVIPSVVVAITWLWIYEPLTGVLNYLLIKTRILSSPMGWLGDPNLALPSLMIENIWRGFPFCGVAFAAALKTIPRQQYEAAKVDGAGNFSCFWNITLPGLGKVWPVVFLLSLIWTLEDFVAIFVMTRGGPAGATHILGTLTYEIGISNMRLGEGIALSMYSAPVLLIIIMLYANRIFKEERR